MLGARTGDVNDERNSCPLVSGQVQIV